MQKYYQNFVQNLINSHIIILKLPDIDSIYLSSMTDHHNITYYLKCMIGGSLACGITHAVIVPLDVLKCKLQINPSYSDGITAGLKKVSKEGKLALGLFPTLVGYSAQGSVRFGFYQIFKDVYKMIVGDANAQKYRKIGWSIAAGSAEFFADFFLCPWQAIKLKIQLSRPGFEFPSNTDKAISKIKKQEGKKGFYKGIVPLWSRQVPYTVVKFVSFEWFVEFFYENIFTAGKQNYSRLTQLSITFGSGFLAGILCAIVSHPADTFLSKIYSQGKSDSSLAKKVRLIYKEIGFKGIWRGLGTRILMIGPLAGSQWWIYDTFKTAVGLQTSGGRKKN